MTATTQTSWETTTAYDVTLHEVGCVMAAGHKLPCVWPLLAIPQGPSDSCGQPYERGVVVDD